MAHSSHDAPYRHYLKEWRERRGLSQTELGKRIGVGEGVISRYETGDRRIHLEVQFMLFAALDITPAQFFSHPDTTSLDALVVRESPANISRIGRLVRAYLDADGE